MFGELKNMFVLTLTDITCNYIEPIVNDIYDMPTLKEKFMKKVQCMGTYIAKQWTYWQNIGKMIGMS